MSESHLAEKINLIKLFWSRKVKERQIRSSEKQIKGPKFAAIDLFPRACILENVTFELSHQNQKKEAQIHRRWFIFTRMYIGNCDFWVVTRKPEKKRPKFAAVDLFPRACILEIVTFELSHENQKKKAQIRRRWFISTRKYGEEIFYGSFY